MTEFELITQVLERSNELISLIQRWASISVGIIAGAQLLERWLHAPIPFGYTGIMTSNKSKRR